MKSISRISNVPGLTSTLCGLMPPWMMPASCIFSRARARLQAMVKNDFKEVV